MGKNKIPKITRKDFEFISGEISLGTSKETHSYIGEYNLNISKQKDSDGQENLWFCLVGKSKEQEYYQFDFDCMSKKRFKKLIKLMKKVLHKKYKD